MVYERGHYVPNENKEEFYEQISEIQHHINFLYKKKNKTSHESDVEVGNQKIVAWLLNRSKEAQSSERSEFFKKLNKEIQREYMHYHGLGQTNPPEVDSLTPFA